MATAPTMQQTSFRRARGLTGTLALLASLATLWSTAKITDEVLWQDGLQGARLHLYPLRLVLLALAAFFAIGGGVLLLRRARRSRALRGALLAGLSLLLTLLGLEAAFMFVPRSHNVGYTLASRIWFERYWGAENSLGYRDDEHVRVPGKQLVFVVGDSFTAGGGIARREQRYSDLLQQCRPDLHVCNLGKNGADTRAEFDNLQRHPLQPDVLVLQYYPNDIDGAASSQGLRMPPSAPYEDLPAVKVRFLVRSSYLLNFIYWLFPHGDVAGYLGYFGKASADAKVLAQHLQDLTKFIDYAQARRIPLALVVFGVMQDPARSKGLTDRVVALFRQRGAAIVEVGQLIGELSVAQRIVNNQDGHASALVHQRVAEALSRVLTKR